MQPKRKNPDNFGIFFVLYGVADGARTHDNRNHNPGLYQLSYSHHGNEAAIIQNSAADRTLFVSRVLKLGIRSVRHSARGSVIWGLHADRLNLRG